MPKPHGKLWNLAPFILPLIIIGALVTVIAVPITLRNGETESDLYPKSTPASAVLPADNTIGSTTNTTTIFTTDYSGYISTISLATTEQGNYTLTQVAKTKACGVQPSWLTYDDKNKILYCADESAAGNVSSYKVTDNGLSLSYQQQTPGGTVHTALYGGSDGTQYMAAAGYSGKLTLYILPGMLGWDYDTFPNGSHIHQAVLDPSKKFMLAPDLGRDTTWIFGVNDSDGGLNQLGQIPASVGCGPRHAVFRKTETMTHMYLVCEKSSQVITYMLDYSNTTTLSGTGLRATTVYPKGAAVADLAAAEIRIIDNDLYVSVRNTKTQTQDYITRLKIDETSGLPSVVEQTTTHGSYPRSMAFNKAGNLAVIGNQKDGTIVVVGRDGKTGELSHSDFVGLKVVDDLSKGGLSSVIFAE